MQKGSRAELQKCLNGKRTEGAKKGAEVPRGKRAKGQKQSKSAIVQKGIRAEV